jgi:hypothetical protein
MCPGIASRERVIPCRMRTATGPGCTAIATSPLADPHLSTPPLAATRARGDGSSGSSDLERRSEESVDYLVAFASQA